MTLMTRLVQLKRQNASRVALVEEPQLRLLEGCSSIYELANSAIGGGVKLSDLARKRATGELLEYDPIYHGRSEWQMLPPIDHPEPARCAVSGTGLTHLGSARNRQSMHASTDADLTDSMKMFRWGVEGGRPAAGRIGVAPEWFYKGNGTILRAHGEPLEELSKRKILVDGNPAGGLLLQIFTKTMIGPIFFEIIQRKGDEGFGEGNFKALFESMELDQVRRGVLKPAA